jgi:CRP/FNR family transcriptional regulator, cyclic AMP receptor protein
MESVDLSLEDRDEILSRLKWPTDLSDTERRKLAKFLIAYRVEKDGLVFQEGEQACYMGLVAEGSLRIERVTDDSPAPEIALLKSGQVFGEMALIDGEPRSATVHAEEESVLLLLSQDNFNMALTELPRLGVKILASVARTMSSRLRETNDNLLEALGQKPRIAANA